MAEPAADQLNRIVQLLAELSRREREGEPAPTLHELAERFDTKPSVILRDIRLATEVSDDPDATWLSSITAYQDGNCVSLSSRGPYRRPIRFTAVELLAMQVALLGDEDNESPVLQELAGVAASAHDVFHKAVSALPAMPGDQGAVVELARSAMNTTRKLSLAYTGEGATQAGERVVQVHDIVAAEGSFYLIAWCERAGDWRRFRCDRVLDAAVTDRCFEPRSDVPIVKDSSDLFDAGSEAVDQVTIRFSPVISRWVLERYPEAEECGNDCAEVTFKTASVDWLVRTVLQYGAEAEVLGPPAYREAVRRAVQA
jgi:predicted DNA-binding transcriptional regulator YafY